MRILRPSEFHEWEGVGDLTPEELAQAYALARDAFTAEDLQRYTEEEEGVPMEDLVRELEALQRQADQGNS